MTVDTNYSSAIQRRVGGPIWSHESIAGMWSKCLRSIQIDHRHEPRTIYTNFECRPAIIIFDAESSSNFGFDILLANP